MATAVKQKKTFKESVQETGAKAKAYAKASVIVRDNNASFASVISKALNIIGKALCCFSYYILIA